MALYWSIALALTLIPQVNMTNYKVIECKDLLTPTDHKSYFIPIVSTLKLTMQIDFAGPFLGNCFSPSSFEIVAFAKTVS